MVPWILEEEKLKGFLAGMRQNETEIGIIWSPRKTNFDENKLLKIYMGE